jgi:hypothetical protein
MCYATLTCSRSAKLKISLARSISGLESRKSALVRLLALRRADLVPCRFTSKKHFAVSPLVAQRQAFWLALNHTSRQLTVSEGHALVIVLQTLTIKGLV